MRSNISLATWCKPACAGKHSLYEAHFNYWRLTGDEEFCRKASASVEDFIECGILLHSPQDVDLIRIFVPHHFEPHAIVDCSAFFTGPLAQGIFNEVLNVTMPTAPGMRYVQLNLVDSVFCRVHCFLQDGTILDGQELEQKRLAAGTLLTITQFAIREACGSQTNIKSYFRLRIPVLEQARQFYVRSLPTPDRFFQSGFEEIEYIDFRVNEARTLPTAVETQMKREGANESVGLTLLAFLTAVPVRSSMAASHSPAHKLRLLENDLWNDYVAGGLPDGMIVYHWKKTDFVRGPDFAAFVKLQTRRTGRSTLAKYLGLAFLLGLFGNLVASLLVMIIIALVGTPSPDVTPAKTQPSMTEHKH